MLRAAGDRDPVIRAAAEGAQWAAGGQAHLSSIEDWIELSVNGDGSGRLHVTGAVRVRVTRCSS